METLVLFFLLFGSSNLASLGFIGMILGKIKLLGSYATRSINPFDMSRKNFVRQGIQARLFGGGIFILSVLACLFFSFLLHKKLPNNESRNIIISIPMISGIIAGSWLYKRFDQTIK